MNAHSHEHLLWNRRKPQFKQTPCTDHSIFFQSHTFNFLHFFIHFIISILQQLINVYHTQPSLLIDIASYISNKYVPTSQTNYHLRIQGVALLNRTPNSTSALRHALEVAECNLTLATAWSDEAEDIYLSIGVTI